MNCLRKLVKKDKQIFGAIAEAYCACSTAIMNYHRRIANVCEEKPVPSLNYKMWILILDCRFKWKRFGHHQKTNYFFRNLPFPIYFTTMLIDKPTSTKHVFSTFSGPSHDIIQSCTSIVNDQHNIVSDLDCFSMEETDFRMIVHAQHAAAHGFTKLVFVTADTDVFIFCLFHWKRLHVIGIQELWIRTGIRDSTRIIPVQVLVETFSPEMCSVLPAVHALTGADYTSKFGTKKVGLNCNPVHFLTNFGISVHDCNMMNSMKKAEEYLVQLWKRG